MTGAAPGPRPAWIHDYGDAGLLVEPEGDAEDQWATAQRLARSLVAAPPHGFVDVVASFRHAFVMFDPLVTDHAAVADAVHDRLAHLVEPRPARSFTIPVCYGGEHGPDLDDVARILELDPQQVVELHTAHPFLLRFVGSPVAAPFVEIPELPRDIARVASPRVRITPGSVGLSGRQSMIYPVPSPGGWRLIGRTPLRLFDLADPDVVPYRTGDRLRFVAIGADAWDEHAGRLPQPDQPGDAG